MKNAIWETNSMASSNNKNIFIAGTLKSIDWSKQKEQLLKDGTEEQWNKAFEEFFMQRISLRYLEPIRILQEEGTYQGEGFSIVTIQCALIEFLAAIKIGKNYRYVHRTEKLRENEYSNSKNLYTDFLTTEEPFREWLSTSGEAEEFYSDVRCALLHEARTKNGWRIWASGEIAIDPDKKIVRRDALQQGINKYIKSYGELLIENADTQKAFIRKFDHLADF